MGSPACAAATSKYNMYHIICIAWPALEVAGIKCSNYFTQTYSLMAEGDLTVDWAP